MKKYLITLCWMGVACLGYTQDKTATDTVTSAEGLQKWIVLFNSVCEAWMVQV